MEKGEREEGEGTLLQGERKGEKGGEEKKVLAAAELFLEFYPPLHPIFGLIKTFPLTREKGRKGRKRKKKARKKKKERKKNGEPPGDCNTALGKLTLGLRSLSCLSYA